MPNRLFGTQTGAGPPLICIHGLAGSHRIFDPVMELLEQHFTVTRIDLLGYGHSDKPHVTYDAATHVAAIHAALEQFNVQRPFVAVGLSMGVDLVLEYARQFPRELVGLVGVGICYYRDEKEARAGLQQNVWTKATLNHPIISRIVIPPIWWLGRHVDALSRRFATIYTPEMAKDALRNPYRVFRSSMWNTLVHTPIDTLLAQSAALPRRFIQGSDDRWSSLEATTAGIAVFANSELCVLDDIAHNAVVLDAPRVGELIVEFARSCFSSDGTDT